MMKVYAWTGFTPRGFPRMTNCSFMMAAPTKKAVYEATGKKPGGHYAVNEVHEHYRTYDQNPDAPNLYEIALASPGTIFILDYDENKQKHAPIENVCTPIKPEDAN